ncbi:NMT1-like family protein [Desulfuromusa kysingii]|uniref:NMT1-like family protein n=1 Tax=Desulfuromusa kysingii TaxID=37625 RepID=A0A1H3X459_9BACT|nr:TAXI family TRAP transporter solute-binding subunit [Desulfuromusa kysingii]SDZ93298.1 NMT1-like family protein [Desulfuromusa kysingii]
MQTKTVGWILCLLLSIALLLSPGLVLAFDVRLGTGPPGSFSYFSGRVFCRLINHQLTDINCQQVAATEDHDAYNLTNLQGGSLDMILVDSHPLFAAVNKTGMFAYLDIDYNNLRGITSLYETPVVMVVRNDAGIRSLADLQGKRINGGTPGTVQYREMKRILTAKGWSREDFSLVGDLSRSQSNSDTKAFCYGTMQAMLYVDIHPDFSLRRLLKSCNGTLLNMDDDDIASLINADPALWKVEIPAGIYSTQPQKVTTFGSRAMLVASENLDQETVYGIMDVLDKNSAYLQSAHQALRPFIPEPGQMDENGLQLHSGAAQYIAEH